MLSNDKILCNITFDQKIILYDSNITKNKVLYYNIIKYTSDK